MRKLKEEKLFSLIRDFLIVYLPEQKCCAQNTIIAYRNALNLLLNYIVEERKISLEKVTLSLFNYQVISDFLNWLEKERECGISTRNHRLSCIRSFLKYAANIDPLLFTYLNEIQRIPLKKTVKTKILEFMSEEALKSFLEQPNTQTKNGMRDLFFMILMYDTAARIGEMLNLKVKDFLPDAKTPSVYLTGKGNKKRVVPVMRKTVEHFRIYCQGFHPGEKYDPSQYLFYTVRHGLKQRMSDDNVARFISGYGLAARAVCDGMPTKVYPHMLRRTRAMHLYRAGMPLALLSEWLGHENPETTLIYAHADTEMKREAVEKATLPDNALNNGKIDVAAWESDDQLIRRLYGLE
jgi:integrase/recombinase XerD